MNRPALLQQTGSGSAKAPAMVSLMVVGLGLAYVFANQIKTENYRNLLIGIVLLQALWVLYKWRIGVQVFLIYVVVEGFLINYFTGVPELNIVKDVLAVGLFGALALPLMVQRRISFLPSAPWLLPFFAFAVLYALQVFNPSLPSLMVGMIGVRVMLLYALLFPVGYWFFASSAHVFQFFSLFLLISVPVSLFGIVQYFLGPSWMLAMSPGFGRAIFYAHGFRPTAETSYFRTFSTFVQTGSFSNYLMLAMLVCAAGLVMQKFRRYRPALLALFVLHLAAMLTSGGRAPLVMTVVGMGLMTILYRRNLRVIPVMVLIPVVFWASLGLVGPAFVDRFETILDLGFFMERNVPLFYGWLSEAMATDWAGLGAGYATVASRHGGVTPLNVNVVENTLAKIRFEAGMPGFLFFLIFIVLFSIDVLAKSAQARDPEIRMLTTACAAYVFLNAVTVAIGTPFDTSPANIYIWFFAGFLTRVASWDQAEAAVRVSSGGVQA